LETLTVEPLVSDARYVRGRSEDYDRTYAVDLARAPASVNATQPKTAETLDLTHDGPTRTQFLHRLQGEVAKRGMIDVLRKGVRHGPVSLVDLFYTTPTPGNTKAQGQFEAIAFSITW